MQCSIQYAFARVRDPSVSEQLVGMIRSLFYIIEQSRQICADLLVWRWGSRVQKGSLLWVILDPGLKSEELTSRYVALVTQSVQVQNKFLKDAHLVIQARSEVGRPCRSCRRIRNSPFAA